MQKYNSDNHRAYNTKSAHDNDFNRNIGEHYNKDQDVTSNALASARVKTKMFRAGEMASYDQAHFKSKSKPTPTPAPKPKKAREAEGHESQAKKAVPAAKKYMRTWALLGGNEKFVIKSARNIIANLLNVAKYNPSEFGDVEIILKVDEKSLKILRDSGYLKKLEELGAVAMTPLEIGELIKKRIVSSLNLQTPEETSRVFADIDIVANHVTNMLKADTKHAFIANQLKKFDKFIARGGQVVVGDESDSVLVSMIPSQNVANQAKSNAYVAFASSSSWTPVSSHEIDHNSDDGLMASVPNMQMFNAHVSRAAEAIRIMHTAQIKIYKSEKEFQSWQSSGLSREDSWVGTWHTIEEVLSRPDLLNMRFDGKHLNELLKGKVDKVLYSGGTSVVADLYWFTADPFAWHRGNPDLKDSDVPIAGTSEFGVVGLFSSGRLCGEAITVDGVKSFIKGNTGNKELDDAAKEVVKAGEKLLQLNEDLSLSFDEWFARIGEVEEGVLQALENLHRLDLKHAREIGQQHVGNEYQLGLYEKIQSRKDVKRETEMRDLKAAVASEQNKDDSYDFIYYQTYIVGSNPDFLLKSLATAALNVRNLDKNAPADVKIQLILDDEALAAIDGDKKLSEHMNHLRASKRIDVKSVTEMANIAKENAKNLMSPHQSVVSQFESSVDSLVRSAEEFKVIGKHSFAVDLLRMIGYNLNPNSINIKSESDAIIMGAPSQEVIDSVLNGNFVTTAFVLDNIPVSKEFLDKYPKTLSWQDMTISACHGSKFFGMMAMSVAQAEHIDLMKRTMVRVYRGENSEEAEKGGFVVKSLYEALISPSYKKDYVYGYDVNEVMGQNQMSGFPSRLPLKHGTNLWRISDLNSDPNIMTSKTWRDSFLINPHEHAVDINALGVSALDFKSCEGEGRCWGEDQKKVDIKIPVVEDLRGILLIKGYKINMEESLSEGVRRVAMLIKGINPTEDKSDPEGDIRRNGGQIFRGEEAWNLFVSTKSFVRLAYGLLFEENKDANLQFSSWDLAYRDIYDAAKNMSVVDFLEFAESRRSKLLAKVGARELAVADVVSQPLADEIDVGIDKERGIDYTTMRTNAAGNVSQSQNMQATKRFVAFEEPLVDNKGNNGNISTVHIPRINDEWGSRHQAPSRQQEPDGVSSAVALAGTAGMIAFAAYAFYNRNKGKKRRVPNPNSNRSVTAINRLAQSRNEARQSMSPC